MYRPRFGRATAIGIAIAALAVAATAGPASAQTDVPPMTDATGNTAFGVNWQFGTPQLPGLLTWNPIAANTTPVVTGNLYLNNSAGVHARLQIVHYDAALNPIATATSNIRTGNGGLDAFPVNFGNIQTVSQHVHIKLRDDRGGVWGTRDELHCTPLMAACT